MTPSADDTPTVTPSADNTPTVTPLPSETPIPSVTPALSVTPTPAPTPTINPEKEVMLRFIDGEGNECEQLRTVLEWNESLILPNVRIHRHRICGNLRKMRSLMMRSHLKAVIFSL